uniref:Scavenger receptor class B member 1 n=1 Tax=Timema shepardi TaxID=629360 RepID=A0A7R9B4X3_TIMSH|nr:unnamed protein product [Timema shepardi]
MGIALRARARVQINLAVSQVVDIKQVATFPDIIFPIMWFEDGIDGLPSQVTDLLDLATNAPPIARAALSYGLFALGGILLILAVSCLVRSTGRQETLNLEGTNHYVKPAKKINGSNGNDEHSKIFSNPSSFSHSASSLLPEVQAARDAPSLNFTRISVLSKHRSELPLPLVSKNRSTLAALLEVAPRTPLRANNVKHTNLGGKEC